MSVALAHRVGGILARGASLPMTVDDLAARDALALEIFGWQRSLNPALDRYATVLLGSRAPASVQEIPAIPTDVFKIARVACFSPAATVRVFRTSGTSHEVRGEHPFADLSLYTASARGAAARWLLPASRYQMICVAQDESLAPDSSLTFMLARFAEVWAPEQPQPFVVGPAGLEVHRAITVLRDAGRHGIPVALLGATWGLVHLADALTAHGFSRIPLPPGSVIMPTGGFKGRVRELSPRDLSALLVDRLGVPPEAIIGEYGMTELSSQAYEARIEGAAAGRYRAPPWLVVNVVNPETLAPLPHGATGLLRLVDLANLGSSIAIQTSDLGRTHPDGFDVLGRAPGATPRGCARALDILFS